MFNGKTKADGFEIGADKPASTSASLIGAGTTMKGDITSSGDLRIDGGMVGNIHCSAKVVIGANGNVQGDIIGQQADIMGKVSGTIKVKDLLQLKGGSIVDGNIEAAKLQIEPTANFNGGCHMTVSTPGAGATHSKSALEVKKEFKHADSAIAPA
jgi:cytoskeletal protein CcmA (bactofilin family)